MASWFGRNDWQSRLDRWTAAALVDAETAAAIREWEASRVKAPGRFRLSDALSYLGISVVLVGCLMLIELADTAGLRIAVALVIGVIAFGTAKTAEFFELKALSDGTAASGVVLTAVGFGLMLDEVGDREQIGVGFLLVCGFVLVAGGSMVRSVRSPLAAFLAAGSLTLAPLALAVEADLFRCGVFGVRELAGWALWSTLGLALAVGLAAQVWLRKPSRWLGDEVVPWARLGSSLGSAAAIMNLAGGSSEPPVDWIVMLVGWLLTAAALRRGRFELLPASAVLLLASLGGGLSDLGDPLRIALTLVMMLAILDLCALGLARSRLLDRGAEHPLLKLWQHALLIGGVVAAAVLSGDGLLGPLGIVWSLCLLVAALRRGAGTPLFYGVVAVYLSGLMLIIVQFESSDGAVFGTVLFGLLLVGAALATRMRRAD